MDLATHTWAHVGDLTFDAPIYGMGVSPEDHELYVIDKNGKIWKVTTQ